MTLLATAETGFGCCDAVFPLQDSLGQACVASVPEVETSLKLVVDLSAPWSPVSPSVPSLPASSPSLYLAWTV